MTRQGVAAAAAGLAYTPKRSLAQNYRRAALETIKQNIVMMLEARTAQEIEVADTSCLFVEACSVAKGYRVGSPDEHGLTYTHEARDSPYSGCQLGEGGYGTRCGEVHDQICSWSCTAYNPSGLARAAGQSALLGRGIILRDDASDGEARVTPEPSGARSFPIQPHGNSETQVSDANALIYTTTTHHSAIPF